MARPHLLKGQGSKRADPAYLERLRALQEARKARAPLGRKPRSPEARHAAYLRRKLRDAGAAP